MTIPFNHTIVHNEQGDTMVTFADTPQAAIDTLLHRFRPRTDDLFVATYPRCGTTWTRQIVHLLLNGGVQGETNFHETVPYLDFSLLGMGPVDHVQHLMGLTTSRYLATHLPYNFMPGVNNGQGRYIYVARNPKDCAVSYYYFCLSLAEIGFDGSWDDFFELFMNGHTAYGNYFDHVLGWWQASRQRNNILFVTYEQMHQDLPGSVARIADFMALPATAAAIEATAAQTRFATMRENPKANMDDVMIPRAEHPHKHLRKGKVGDWRTLFTADQNARMDAVYQEKWVSAGLEISFT